MSEIRARLMGSKDAVAYVGADGSKATVQFLSTIGGVCSCEE
jgi:hypothetical protein